MLCKCSRPFPGDAYNLQSISAILRKVGWFTRLARSLNLCTHAYARRTCKHFASNKQVDLRALAEVITRKVTYVYVRVLLHVIIFQI